MSFLKAEWRKLILANYKVDPEILKPFVPTGTELDLWNDTCYVSLVGFMFVNTKLLGIKIPFHVNFEEVNLRFYVKRFENGNWKRGVVFIKEIVPKPALTFVANTVYKENYETLPMSHCWETGDVQQTITYRWSKNDKWQQMSVVAGLNLDSIEPRSEAEFITEHYWGYAHIDNKYSNEYEVTHPKWEVYPVLSYAIQVDFNLIYGSTFAFLNHETPLSVFLAEGSRITVESKRKIS